MKLIAGLGNPGRDYDNTFHNIGFDVVDAVCRRLGGEWKESRAFTARVAKVALGATALLLVQPMTFMNVSGQSVGPLMHYYKMTPADVVAVLDDVELPPGKLRIRASGGDGGHNGLASLINAMGTAEFPRVRVGVGRGAHGGQPLAHHVLSRIPAETRQVLDKMVTVAADAVCLVAQRGVDEAMNTYNGLTFTEEDKPC